jgi:hypothetical protein
MGAAGSAKSEEQKAAEEKEASMKKRIADDFALFVSSNCPELKSTRDQADELIAKQEAALAEIEAVLRSRNMEPDKDKDVKRSRAALAKMTKIRNDLSRQIDELFVRQQKIRLSPDQSEIAGLQLDAKLANELAKSSQKALDKTMSEMK